MGTIKDLLIEAAKEGEASVSKLGISKRITITETIPERLDKNELILVIHKGALCIGSKAQAFNQPYTLQKVTEYISAFTEAELLTQLKSVCFRGLTCYKLARLLTSQRINRLISDFKKEDTLVVDAVTRILKGEEEKNPGYNI